MLGRIRIIPYKQGSKSAKALADAIGGKVLKLEGSKYKYKKGDMLINWGSSNNKFDTAFNSAEAVATASNKLKFFQKMDPAIIPKFWTNKEDIPDDAYPIVCRTVLSGHSGAGIVIADTREQLVEAPLYVKYIKKMDEYRVHLGEPALDDEPIVIATQRKARRLDVENPDWKVRNHENGFIYARDREPPYQVIDAAKTAFYHSELTFGAFDVLWNEREQKAYVLEVNTAPGLEGQTVEDYVNFFKEAARNEMLVL